MLNEEERDAIADFFSSVDRLKTLGILRSDKYLGDIGEFLCTKCVPMTLAESQRQPGHDGNVGPTRCQVKYSGGMSTTVDCGDPAQYDELYVVLGPKSEMRRGIAGGQFLIYRVPANKVLERPPHSDGKRRYTMNQLLAVAEHVHA